MLNHTGQKLHHCRFCDCKFNHIASSRTQHTDEKLRTLNCSLCGKTIVGQKNYYLHYLDAHTEKSIRSPQTNQCSSSDRDKDVI